MYAWIWRHLPFGLRWKIAECVFIAAGITVLLWFVVFPVVEPRMPFNDGQLDDQGGGNVPTSQRSTAGQENPSPGASGPLVSGRVSPSASMPRLNG